MKSAMSLTLALLSASALTEAVTFKSKEHPIVGVISLLEDLQVQAKEEGEKDASTYQKFTYWCSNAQKDITASMDNHKETLETTNDNIKSDKSSIMAIEFALRKLSKEITRREASNSRALEKRQEDEADYEEDQTDYEDTIKAFGTAIKAMELTQKGFLQTSKAAQSQKVLVAKRAVKKAMVLAETRATEEQMKVFKSFIQTGAAPHSQGVDKHGSVVIDLLKSLMADFEKQKVESVKEETEDKNQYNLAKQAQDYAIKEANSNRDTKNTDLSDKKTSLGDNEATRNDEEGALAADTAQLNSVKADCTTKANEWDVRSKTRMGEIEAMSMAVKILAKVTNVRNPDSHEQPKRVYLQKGVSLLQINDPKAKAVNLLKQAATRTHSKALQKLATEIGNFAGPFDKIKAMIQKMVFRLMAEQKDEDDHKNWCDLELEKTNESKDDKDNRMELLNNKIANANAEVAKLTGEIAEDDQSVSDITQYMEEEKELRKENHDENVATIKDAQAAQQAVADATAVLKGFYKESGMIAKEPYEFVQTSKRDIDLPENPSTWDASYTGTADPNAEGSGVLAILGECGSNFASMEADASSQEEMDERAYQDDQTAQSMDKAEKEKSAEMKGSRKTALMEKLDGMNGNKAHLTKELEAVNTYLKDLEPACVSGDSSYAERKAARADEIAALRNAQVILEEAFNPSGFLQKKN
jgi:hypothetical protein